MNGSLEWHTDGTVNDPDKGIYNGRITERIEFKQEKKQMKIQCECGKEMEDSGNKVNLGSEAYYDDRAFEYKVICEEFSLFVCKSCGVQALYRKLEKDECYEL